MVADNNAIMEQHTNEPSSSRKPSRAYRLLHSCQYSGHLLKKSRWTMKWSFGLANLEAVRDGKKGNDCRGEEHEVQFVCFVKSKKVRIYWNGRNITHLFREASRKEDQLAVAWQARSGEIFQVASGSNSSPQGKPQYDFFIDGRSFSSLPSVAELGAAAFGLARDERRSPVDECCAEKIEVCSLGYEVSEASSGVVPELEEGHGEEAIFEEAPAGQNFRLSMAGLTPSRPGDEVVDELRSDLYSSTIEVLRNQITECIPETEELVSRAVINAFFSGDDESRTSHDSISESFSEPFPGAIHFEVDSMSQAYEWLRLNRNHALRPDHKERKLEFLQKQVDAVMLEIRRERLSANEACQILFSVACVLGLVVNPVLENTAIVLVGLGKGAKDNDLHSELKWYGEISAAAVSEDGDIGLVRYAYPASVGLATEASDRKEIIIRGQASVACGLLDAEKALCLSFLNMQEDDGFLRQQDEITPESCPSPQFMVGADFSPVSASKNNSLPTVLVTPENNSQLMPAQQVLRGKGSPGDKDCISNRTVSTLATQDSEAGIYTPIVYSRGSFE